MRKYLSKEDCKAFSLMELITAIFIFSVGMMAVFGIFYKCVNSARQMYHYQLAGEIVQSEIEYLRNLDYSQVKNCKVASFLGPMPDLQKLKNSSGKLTIDDYMDPGIKKVTVSVSWSEEKLERSTGITTLIAKRD